MNFGSATITAAAGGKTATCNVTVNSPEDLIVTASNRAAVGYTGEVGKDLYISSYFIGDGNNETVNRRQYTVTGIDSNAFRGCNNLNSVCLDDYSIGAGAFADCANLTSVMLPISVSNMTLGAGVFANCTSLTSINIPNGIMEIANNMFTDCANLTDITYNGTKAQWDYIAKSYNWDAGTGDYTIHCTDGDIAKS